MSNFKTFWENLFGPASKPAEPLGPLLIAPAEPSPADLQTTMEFEGFRSAPYQDVGGVWTIGYGSTRDVLNRPVTADTPCVSRQQAQLLLRRDMQNAMSTLAQQVHVPLTPNEQGALADFIYNLGATNFDNSTLLKLLNAGDYEGAAKQFERWDYAGGKVCAGLLRRRLAEMKQFEANGDK
jgi:lysozyme